MVGEEGECRVALVPHAAVRLFVVATWGRGGVEVEAGGGVSGVVVFARVDVDEGVSDGAAARKRADRWSWRCMGGGSRQDVTPRPHELGR